MNINFENESKFSLPKFTSNSALADLTFGSAAGLIGRLIEHPFDTVKVRVQTTNQFKGPIDCFKKTWQTEGIRGFYKGLASPLYGAVFENAVIFATYNTYQEQIKLAFNRPLNHSLVIQDLCLAGALSGATISFILTPVEYVKCNLQVQDVTKLYSRGELFAQKPITPQFNGPIHVIKQTLKLHGIRGLYQGHTGTMLRESIGNAAWFGAYESVCLAIIKRKESLDSTEKVYSKDDLGMSELMLAGAAAGMSYQAAFFPADVVKSRQQTHEILSGGSRTTFVKVALDLFKSDGVSGFFRGFGMTVLRSAPTSAAIFATYELMKRNFTA